jgi:hypothetical protein
MDFFCKMETFVHCKNLQEKEKNKTKVENK